MSDMNSGKIITTECIMKPTRDDRQGYRKN